MKILDSSYCNNYTIIVVKKLERFRAATFGLEELVQAAEDVLGACRLAVADGRVGAALDGRTVRYYQTFGLIDRPQRFEGRRALYGYRHLVQLLAIRALQTQRLPLAVIQQMLTGQSTAQLEARVKAALEAGLAVTTPGIARSSAAVCVADSRATAAATAPGGERHLLAAELAPGVTVLVDSQKVTDPRGVLERIRACLDAYREDV